MLAFGNPKRNQTENQPPTRRSDDPDRFVYMQDPDRSLARLYDTLSYLLVSNATDSNKTISYRKHTARQHSPHTFLATAGGVVDPAKIISWSSLIIVSCKVWLKFVIPHGRAYVGEPKISENAETPTHGMGAWLISYKYRHVTMPNSIALGKTVSNRTHISSIYLHQMTENCEFF